MDQTNLDSSDLVALITVLVQAMPTDSSCRPSFPMKIIPINPNHLIKLNDTNFLICLQQLKHVIWVYGLQNFINNSVPTPPQYIKKKIQDSNRASL